MPEPEQSTFRQCPVSHIHQWTEPIETEWKNFPGLEWIETRLCEFPECEAVWVNLGEELERREQESLIDIYEWL